MIRRPVLSLAIVLSACCFGYAQKKECPVSSGEQALTEADTLRSWDALYKSYGQYRRCDDGATAEGYSESVARILVDNWSILPRLSYLVKKDPNFRQFVLLHVDATLNTKDLEKIRTEAETQCPTGLHTLCDDLRKEANSALKEAP